jgi:hypothetical protein
MACRSLIYPLLKSVLNIDNLVSPNTDGLIGVLIICTKMA